MYLIKYGVGVYKLSYVVVMYIITYCKLLYTLDKNNAILLRLLNKSLNWFSVCGWSFSLVDILSRARATWTCSWKEIGNKLSTVEYLQLLLVSVCKKILHVFLSRSFYTLFKTVTGTYLQEKLCCWHNFDDNLINDKQNCTIIMSSVNIQNAQFYKKKNT